MGIGGHILGPVKLRRLNRLTGMEFNRAYIRGHDSEAVRWPPDGGCEHFVVDTGSWAIQRIEKPVHWSTCPSRRQP